MQILLTNSPHLEICPVISILEQVWIINVSWISQASMWHHHAPGMSLVSVWYMQTNTYLECNYIPTWVNGGK